MIRLFGWAFLATALAFLVAGGIFTLNENRIPEDEERQKLWKQVDEDVNAGKPRSAIDKLKLIYDGAAGDEAWPEATHALCRRFLLEGQIDQPLMPYVIRQMQAAIPEAPEQMRPVMKTILAEWFYSYYMQNQWRFMQRSQTAVVPSDDFETWDLTRILNEIDRNFTEALAESDTLKQIPIETYDELLARGTVTDAHRPVLFDFIAFEALGFYSLDEQFIRQQGAFRITADSPIFATSDEFLAWQPPTGDEDSFLLRAVRLYQEVLRFHADDDDRTAWLDADLGRLAFGNRVATGSEKKSRYRAALQRYADEHVRHPLSSMALAQLASSQQSDEEFVEAKTIAEQGKSRFPDSIGGRKCHNIIQQILARSASVKSERVWNVDPVVDITYRNVDKAYFRMVPFDYAGWRDWGNYQSPQRLRREDLERMLRGPSAMSWSAELPPTEDYKQRTEQLPVDVDVKSGCYLLFCSHNPRFRNEDNQISVAEVWVSNLAVVMRRIHGSDKIAGNVHDAISGEPVSAARVRKAGWIYDGRNSRQTRFDLAQTNADGYFEVPHEEDQYYCKFFFTHDDQKFGLIENFYRSSYYIQPRIERTVFFTDRSIYRPGQSIQFKGICVSSDQQTNKYDTLPGRKVSVVLVDMNQQEVERREFRTNEYGSFSGSFTAPRDRATGNMTLRCETIGGASNIRVEEYKRPKFYVEIDKPDEAFRLGQQVTMTGNATAYTGAPIDGSKVVWRVVREVQYPRWYSWRYWYLPQTGESQEIANGELTTDVDGKFEISFTAEPDPSVARENEPVFSFSIYADVTDSAGETRSSQQTTRVGYTSLSANLTCDSWQTTEEAVEVSLSVTTLDSEGQESSGTLKIYRLTPPEKVARGQLPGRNYWYFRPAAESEPDMSRINSWPLGEVVFEQELTTDTTGNTKAATALEAGAYKATYETTDPAGARVTSEVPILVVETAADKFNVRIPNHFDAKSWSVEPGEDFVALWGTGYDDGTALVEFEHRGEIIQSFRTARGSTQRLIRFPVEEKHRGGVNMRVTYVRENRAYLETRRINVPWSNKMLTIKWEHFVSNLQPGGRETWTAVVTGPDAEKAAAEMVAGLYDASLDAFVNHMWQGAFNLFYQDRTRTHLQFANSLQHFNNIFHSWQVDAKDASFHYRYFKFGLGARFGMHWSQQRYSYARGARMAGGWGGGDMPGAVEGLSADSMSLESAAAPRAPASASRRDAGVAMEKSGEAGPGGPAFTPPVDLSAVTARKNMQETAFFFPHLLVDDAGNVRIEFEIPEALTRWKFLGFAHDNQLRAAMLSDEMTTSKDLMVQPNPPRFLREGDLLEFSVKVSNQSDDPQTGSVRLTFADARTMDSVDEAFSNQKLDQNFEIPAGQSTSLYWKIKVPDYVGVLAWKAVGATEKLSDGEEGMLPVLSKRILVTESLPLPIRGNQTRQFLFDRLKLAEASDTLQSQTLTVQMTSNPAWYAVMALPYLMEYPHQCSEQVFNRYYANTLARHIVTSDPKIERIFEQWRGTDALDSPLEKNEDIRNVMIAESPWLLAGKKESQARRDVGILFDENRLNAEMRRAFSRLEEMQYSDGSWPWFPGGQANDYITLYITTGFGRLRNLGTDIDVAPAIRAVERLDYWMTEIYKRIKRNGNLGRNNLSPGICLYLYTRSFFLDDRAVDDQYKEAFDYWISQAKTYWVDLNNRQSQGHLALGLKRIGDRETPLAIMTSLTERSLTDDEMGMFWREGDLSWWWYKAPIETQALMIEAYDEVLGDAGKVEELKIWLLKQKQTQNWKTTKATADACYGILLRGTDLLASDQLVSVKLGSTKIEPEDVEAGTGFYEQRFVRAEILPEMGDIEVVKSDDGIAWGSVHWQYLEDVGKIEPYEGTPLTLKKGLFIKRNTDKGPVIEPVEGPVAVGDELVMRVELRVDRAMEYVHLKDYRGSGTEPVNVLSRYKFQDGLAYYESTKDTASHFFIDYLPRGTYVFEYSVRVQHRGVYETGIAELQCMYAPEFNSHSGSVEITVE